MLETDIHAHTSLELKQEMSLEAQAAMITTLDKTLAQGTVEALYVDAMALTGITVSHLELLGRIRQVCEKHETAVYLKVNLGLSLDTLDALRVSGSPQRDDLPDDDQLAPGVSGSGTPEEQESYFDEFLCTPAAAADAYIRFQDFLRTTELDVTMCYSLRTVYYEFVNNVIQHSEMDRADKLTITLSIQPDRAVVSITDTGHFFDISKEPGGPRESCEDRRLERLSFGIDMLKKLTNSIHYSRHESTNLTRFEVLRRSQ